MRALRLSVCGARGVVDETLSAELLVDFAPAFATIATVLQTAQKQGQEPLTTLSLLLGPPLDFGVLTQPPWRHKVSSYVK